MLKNHNKNYHTNIIHKCNFCNIKEYKIYVSFKKHEKICKEKFEQKEKEKYEREKYEKEEKYNQELLDIKKEELLIKKEELMVKKNFFNLKKQNYKGSKSNIKLLNINNQIINQHQHIYNFVTHEDVNSPNHIKNLLSKEEQLKFVMEIHPSYYLTEIIQKTYCDKFKNVCLTNKNGKYIYVYETNKFIIKDCDTVIENIVKGKSCEIKTMINGLLQEQNKNFENSNINSVVKIKNIDNLLENIDKIQKNNNDFIENSLNENIIKKNKKRVFLLLYNNHEKILKNYTLLSNEELNEEQLHLFTFQTPILNYK